MKKLVVFTGAGVSADSGLATFRDSDGTWGNYRIEEVCIPEALDFNRRGVIRFYNERRAEMLKAEPNAAHRAIAGLERDFDVRVITQNVDNLHERAGSTHILHLHGELTKLRSTDDPSLILPFDGVEQGFDDRAPDGSLLRPHIVFFGEPVPEFDRAAELAAGADILMVVGTSLAVYPAASLVRCVRPDIPVYVVDPGRPAIRGVRNPLEVIRKRAAEGVPELADRLRAFGADVTVFARKESDRAFAEAFSCRAAPIEALAERLGEADVLFNTAPAALLAPEALDALKPEAVFIELASRPCCDSERLLLSPALPARTAPAAAAQYIYDEIRPHLFPAADG